jgi:branched-chain amino acid transport system permease protein
VLFIGWIIVRRIVYSPFGRSLTGIRENEARMHAIGTPVFRRRLLTAYSISAALAGVAGALIAQTTQFVATRRLWLRALGQHPHHAAAGRHRPALRRLHRRPLYMIAQDQLRRDRSGLLVFLDRLAAGAGGALRARRRARHAGAPQVARWSKR